MDAEEVAPALQPQARAPPQAELDDVQPVVAGGGGGGGDDAVGPQPDGDEEERVVLVPPQEPALARVPPPAATVVAPGGAAPADECLLHGVECPQRPRGGWKGHERELRLHLNIACDGGQEI